jgi:glycosyltransferase involved in cell wall biosynthesis
MNAKFLSGGLRKGRILKNDKKDLPLVSVITVVLNNKKFLQQSINSVLNQSYENYELIIIDGKSTDGTVEILKKNNSKIDLWISEKDKSIYDAMNKGIKLSRGSIISILNSDDIFYKHALKTATNYFNQYQNIDFLFGSVIKYKLLYGYKPWKISWSFGFYSTHSIGFFIRKKAQNKVGYYNVKYKYSADYDLFYRMIVNYNMKGMATKKKEIFGKFRRGGISSKLSNNVFLKEIYQVRVDNGQNKIFVLFLILLKYLRFNLKKFLKL